MKSFPKNKITKKCLRQQIITFAKFKNVKNVYFNNHAKFIKGSYNSSDQTIFLSNTETKQSMLCTFFHELSHHLAVEQHKWLDYHYDRGITTSIEMFEIENGIDKIAKKLWNEHVNITQWGKYKYAYPKTQKKLLTKWLINYHK